MNGGIAYSILPNRKGDETEKLITSSNKPERCFKKRKVDTRYTQGGVEPVLLAAGTRLPERKKSVGGQHLAQRAGAATLNTQP